MSPKKNDPDKGSLPGLETFREVMRLKDPNGNTQTLTVTRKGTGESAAVWLSLAGTAGTTVVLTGGKEDEVADMLNRAKEARYVRPPFKG